MKSENANSLPRIFFLWLPADYSYTSSQNRNSFYVNSKKNLNSGRKNVIVSLTFSFPSIQQIFTKKSDTSGCDNFLFSQLVAKLSPDCFRKQYICTGLEL